MLLSFKDFLYICLAKAIKTTEKRHFITPKRANKTIRYGNKEIPRDYC